jgi:hypothetical protein
MTKNDPKYLICPNCGEYLRRYDKGFSCDVCLWPEKSHIQDNKEMNENTKGQNDDS